MPCDSMRMAQEQREELALELNRVRALERLMQSGEVKLVRDVRGKPKIVGWQDRGGWHDDCALRVLTTEGSTAARMALARLGEQRQKGVIER